MYANNHNGEGISFPYIDKGEIIMIDRILFSLLLLDGNETNIIKVDTYNLFKTLLIELTKIKYNIRFCSKMNCICHPETIIKEILQDNNLKEFLINNSYYKNIVDDIEELISDYNPIIAEGIYEN